MKTHPPTQLSSLARNHSVFPILVLLGLWSEPTVGRADGVTLITHGYNPSIARSPAWMASMREAISTNFLGGAQRYGTITVRSSVGALVADCDPWNVDLSVGTNGDILVVLDWSPVASSLATGVSAQSVAAAVVDRIVTGQNGQRPLAELPLHLIGHSRGGSLVCELARLLGERGVVVDHLTPLDPHPLTTSDPQPTAPAPPVIDTPVAIYQNVVFADVYAQLTDYPKGEYLPGACNRLWGELSGGYYNNRWPYNSYAGHRNMMLLYQSTVTLTNPVNNGEATMGATERVAWFNAYEAAGTNTGFTYSRIAGRGDWTSTNRPVGGGDEIRAGLNRAVAFGGAGTRASLTWSAAAWPNVARLDVLANGTALGSGKHAITVGTIQQLRYVYLDYDSGCTVTLHVDTDRNPYNHNDLAVISTSVTAAATGGDYAQNTVAWDTSALPAGTTTYVYAQVTDGTRTRYCYAMPALRLVSVAKPQPIIASIRRLGNSLIFTGSNGQPHATYYELGSTNVALPLSQWLHVQTNVFDETGSFSGTNNLSTSIPWAFYQFAY